MLIDNKVGHYWCLCHCVDTILFRKQWIILDYQHSFFSDKKNVTAVAAAADPNLRHIVGHHVDVVSVTHVQRAEDDVGGQPGHLILTPNTHIHTTWNLLVVFIFIYFVRSIFLFPFFYFSFHSFFLFSFFHVLSFIVIRNWLT